MDVPLRAELRRRDLGKTHTAKTLYMFELLAVESSLRTTVSRPTCSVAWSCIQRTGPSR